MLPLLALTPNSTGVIDNSELIEKAKQFKTRRESGNETPQRRPSDARPPVAVPEAVRRAQERAARASKLEAAKEMQSIAAEVLKREPETESESSEPYTEDPDSDEDDYLGPEDGFAINADDAFDDHLMGLKEAETVKMEEFLTVIELQDIIDHLKEADNLVVAAMSDASSTRQTALFGIHTRILADMGLLRGMKRHIMNSHSEMLVRSPRTVNDAKRLDREVQTIVNSGTFSDRAMEAMNALLPTLSMLVYLLGMYYAPGMQLPYVGVEPKDIPVVYPPLYYDITQVDTPPPSFISLPPDDLPFVPNVTPTQRRRARGMLHSMVLRV